MDLVIGPEDPRAPDVSALLARHLAYGYEVALAVGGRPRAGFARMIAASAAGEDGEQRADWRRRAR